MEKKFSSLLFCSLLILPFIFSCSPDPENVPAGILPKDKMIEVLVDVHIAESSIDNHRMSAAGVNSLMVEKYDSLMRKHDTTLDNFKKSFNYYEEHPDVFDGIYQEVVNRLSAMEGKARAKRAKPRSEGVDSLK